MGQKLGQQDLACAREERVKSGRNGEEEVFTEVLTGRPHFLTLVS